MSKYYVYMYMDQDNCPFYIGKGQNIRWYPSGHIKGRSYTATKIKSIGVKNVKVRFLHENLTEEQSFYLEEYYIAGYGRRDLGLGPLTNHTNGGQGSSQGKNSQSPKYHKEWRKVNNKKNREAKRRYYIKNKEKKKAYVQKWSKNNRDKCCEYANRYYHNTICKKVETS